MATVRILGDVPYYNRRSLAHEFDPLDYSIDRVLTDVYYLSYYAKNRDAVAADKKGKVVEDGDEDVKKRIIYQCSKSSLDRLFHMSSWLFLTLLPLFALFYRMKPCRNLAIC